MQHIGWLGAMFDFVMQNDMGEAAGGTDTIRVTTVSERGLSFILC